MNNYRIIEKTGTTRIEKVECNCECCYINKNHTLREVKFYVSRYIVQKLIDDEIVYLDIDTFTSLNEAKEYLRELRLKDGIIVY